MPSPHTEEHELPCLEAVLAGTLALMTGYSQAMQAELDPGQRLHLGQKIGDNLTLLVDQPSLSTGFRQVLFGLRARWQAMSDCTAQAACACGGPAEVPGLAAPGPDPTGRFHVAAPKRIQ